MSHYCDVCDKTIKLKTKIKHLKKRFTKISIDADI